MPFLLMRVKRRNDKEDQEEVGKRALEVSERKASAERLTAVENRISELQAGQLTNEQQIYRIGQQEIKNTTRGEEHERKIIQAETHIEGIKDKVNSAEDNVKVVMQLLMSKR